MIDHALAIYDQACAMVAQAKTLDEVKELSNKADAIRIYARQAKNRALELDAMEIRLRAERRMGQMIVGQKQGVGLDPGGRPSAADEDADDVDDPRHAFGTLSELGISRDLSSRSQKMAALDDADFDGYLADVRADGEVGVQRVTQRLLKRVSGEGGLAENPDPEGKAVEHLNSLVEQGQTFGTIYLDPPWRFETRSDKGKDRSPERHYVTMSVEEIAALPVPQLASQNAAVQMWATWPMLRHALSLFDGWGFRYSTCSLVWIKTRGGDGSDDLFSGDVEDFVVDEADLHVGTGYWSRANSEFVLLATRGHPVRLNRDVHQVIISPLMAHSRKPEEAARRIERLTPGPYLEMFARRPRAGWTVWGNEVITS